MDVVFGQKKQMFNWRVMNDIPLWNIQNIQLPVKNTIIENPGILKNQTIVNFENFQLGHY